MIGGVLKKIFGTQNDRILKSIQPYVAKINEKEPELKNLSNEQLKERFNDVRKRYEDKGDLDAVLIDSFAITR